MKEAHPKCIMSSYNMPFRAIGKMTGGVVGGFFKQHKVKKKADSME